MKNGSGLIRLVISIMFLALSGMLLKSGNIDLSTIVTSFMGMSFFVSGSMSMLK